MTSGADWETRAQVDACRDELGVSEPQLARWRSEEIMPPVQQVPFAYDGSEVRHPVGTCAQLRAAHTLMAENRTFAYVGPRLWWQGYTVDEKHWRPGLQKFATFLDGFIPLVARFLQRPAGTGVRADVFASAAAPGSVLTRSYPRLEPAERPTFVNALASGTGRDARDLSNSPDIEGERTPTEIMLRGLGLDGVDKALVFGESLRFEKAFPQVWAQIGEAIARGDFQAIANGPREPIERARDQARQALEAARASYSALAKLYPGLAQGFWLAKWFADHLKPEHVPLLIFVFVRLQEVDALISDEAISDLWLKARQLEAMADQIEQLRDRYPEFREVFTPRRIRASFRDVTSQRRFTSQIRAARMKIETRLGSDHVITFDRETLPRRDADGLGAPALLPDRAG